uniref:IclR family transcriptional regulator n=1 Tax=Marinobacterium profundum TaxID=1714300 RepID=UPI0008374407|nr:helix-turn-helix domain-containing protein [Marinobacterium profundum]
MAERRVEAVERALTLLEAFSEEQRELSLAELARATGFYKSTILRLMASLEAFGYVARDERGIFRIGPAVARLAPLSGQGINVEKLIRPILKSLRDASGETASFYIRAGDERICRFRENGRHEVRHHLEEGARLPMGVGAAARVLNHGTEPHTVAVSVGEREPSLAAAAIAILKPSGELLGALALSGPKERFMGAEAEHSAVLIEKARELETQLPQGSLVI